MERLARPDTTRDQHLHRHSSLRRPFDGLRDHLAAALRTLVPTLSVRGGVGMSARGLGLLAGYLADQRWGDPQRCHPVAGFGALAARLEARVYAAHRTSGVIYVATLVGGTAAAGMAVEKVSRRRPILRFLTTAVSTWAVLGGRSLATEAETVHHHLEAGDLPAARERLTHLVGRDTAQLDESGIARAVIESVAENTSD